MKPFFRSLPAILVFLGALVVFGPEPAAGQDTALSVDSVEALPGFPGVAVPVRVSSDAPVSAIQIALDYDELTSSLTGITLAGVLSGFPIEFVDINIDATDGTASTVVVLDSSAPFDNVLDPGDDLLFAVLTFDLESMLLPGTVLPIALAGPVGNPPVTNEVFVDGAGTGPDLFDGAITVTNENFLMFGPATAVPDTSGNPVDINALNSDNVQAFSLVVSYDPTLVNATEVNILDTITEAVGAEFVDPIIDNSAGFIILGVLLDALPPYEGQVIPSAGLELAIARVVFDVLPEANNVDQVDLFFEDGLGSPPINNVFVIGNQSVAPITQDGFIEIIGDPIFLRGDANNDTILDLADPIFTICFLTGVVTDPPCQLAMDANDDDALNLADVLYSLNYQFLGGPIIPAPFPDPGTDPTPADPPLPCDL